jgi:type I restriction enzyme M protein
MFVTVKDEVFPFIKTLGSNGGTAEEGDSTYSHHMKDAIFMMPTPRVLANVVDQLDGIDMADTDTKGDLYEYMLGKIASAGQNGQFRTPRHIIRLMVDMTAPTPKDVICDPACGTAGFLIAASEYLREHHGDAIYKTEESRRRFNSGTFHGYDFDSTMLRIGSMNMLLHGVENPDIRYRDSLAQSDQDDAERYSLVLANPPFAGSLDYESTAKDLQQIVKTKKTELLFLALFLRLLQTGGRAAVIVPDGVLFGSSKAHKALRRSSSRTRSSTRSSPCPRACSSPTPASPPPSCSSPRPTPAAPTTSGSTTCRPTATRWTTSARRSPGRKIRPASTSYATAGGGTVEHGRERLANRKRTGPELPRAEGRDRGNDYDLSINRYKEVEYEAVGA